MTDAPTVRLRTLNPVPSSQAPGLDELWRRLEAEEPTPGRDDRAERPPWGSRILVAALIAVTVVVGIGAVLALRPGSNNRRAHPSTAADAAALTRILGVLRRPQTAADLTVQIPASLFRDRQRLTAPGTMTTETMTPLRSLLRLAATLPGAGQVGLLPVDIHSSGSESGQISLAVVGSGGGDCCNTSAQIRAGQAFSSSGGGGQENTGVLIVPDGVARVRINLPHPTTVAVRSNVAVIQASADLENLNQYAMTWYASSGALIRRFAAGRTVPPTATQTGAIRDYALRLAEKTTVPIRPAILHSYPLFGRGASLPSVNAGAVSFSVSHPTLTHVPTGVLEAAHTLVGYRTDPRTALRLRVKPNFELWLAAGDRICIYDQSDARATTCTPRNNPSDGLIVTAPGRPSQRMLVALVPHNNETVRTVTDTGSRTVPVRDGLVVSPAAHVIALRFRSAAGATLSRQIDSN